MENVTKPQLPPKLLITDLSSSEVSERQCPWGSCGFAWDGEQDRQRLRWMLLSWVQLQQFARSMELKISKICFDISSVAVTYGFKMFRNRNCGISLSEAQLS